MSLSKNKLIPGEALIYERANGVVYAKYRDAPHNTKPRWIVGGDPVGIAKATGKFLSYSEWEDLCRQAESNLTLRRLMEKLVNTYYLVKENND